MGIYGANCQKCRQEYWEQKRDCPCDSQNGVCHFKKSCGIEMPQLTIEDRRALRIYEAMDILKADAIRCIEILGMRLTKADVFDLIERLKAINIGITLVRQYKQGQ